MKSRLLLLLFVGALFLFMIWWEIYVNFYASRAAIITITTFKLDKFVHVIGGIFIAGSITFASRRRGVVFVLAMTVVIALLWEAAEMLFDPKVSSFFERERKLWIQDSIGDFFASLGGAALFLFLRRRR